MMINFNIMIYDDQTKAVTVDESKNLYKKGWNIVNMIQAEDAESALEIYRDSFSNCGLDEHFLTVSSKVKNTPDKNADITRVAIASAYLAKETPIHENNDDIWFTDDPLSSSDININTASRLPMMDGIEGFDVAGNTFGTDTFD